MAPRILCVVGTRPEAVKMAPVILALRRERAIAVTVLCTGQHAAMVAPVLAFFGIVADRDLGLMQADQSLAALTARALTALDQAYAELRPDLVVAQGDTTTVAMAALAAFCRQIPFAHVEAGLRTGDLHNPFPEEFNRLVAGRLASLHFAPTAAAAAALRSEGVPEATIYVTGNTVIDALKEALARNPPLPFALEEGRRVVLVTLHRRESFGPSIRSVCEAVRELAERPDVEVVWPLHPNPNVRRPVLESLVRRPYIRLCDPLPYAGFIAVMAKSSLVLTDSSGVQEAVPTLGIPVLVLRDKTERPEAIELGAAKLVGTHRERIVAAAVRLLDEPAAYAAMTRGVSPYGDGKAADRIAVALGERFWGDVRNGDDEADATSATRETAT